MQYWKLLDNKGNPVAPLEFEGKTQADVVKEIVDAFSSYDVVFFISPTGTGKSAIAMNVIANAFSAGIIVVPTKHLQKQYYNDFNAETGKFKIKGIDIRFILGRNNFTCPYLNNTVTCDNPTLPCTRRLDKFEPRYKVAGECFTEDTFVLTPNGIKKISELKEGDEVYAIDIYPTNNIRGTNKSFGIPLKGTEKIVKAKVKKVIKRRYKGEIIEFYNSHFSVRVTPDHRVIHKRNNRSKIAWECSADDLFNTFTSSVVLLTGKEIEHCGIDDEWIDLSKFKPNYSKYNKNRHIKFETKFKTKDFLELLGWYISEGCIINRKKHGESYVCKIAQFKHRNKLIKLLKRLKIRFNETEKGVFRFSHPYLCKALMYYGGKYANKKFIHHSLFKYSKKLLKHLFNTLMIGDGSRYKTFLRYTTKSERLANDITLLAYILGYKVTVYRDKRRGMFKLTILNAKGNNVTSVRIRKTNYDGYVYDVEVVPNHNLLVSNNRYFFVCFSNCPYWCPRYPDKESLISKVEQVTGKMPVKYRTAAGEYVIFMGDDPEDDCPYLRQYRAYVEANVIVMNDKLWLIETLARRKPIFIGGIEVWDEGDSLLEKLITATTISERKFKPFFSSELQTMWSKIMSVAKGDVLREYIYEFISKLEERISKISNDEEAEALVWKLRKIIDEYDEYIIRIEPKEKKIYFFYKNVAEYLRKILRLSNQKILIMSATLQDKKVLEEYYGFDNYTIIYGKTKYPGKIYLLKTKRWWVTHKTFEKIKDAMVKETMAVVKHAEKHGLKTLIHVHAFKYVNDLPVKLDSSDNDYFEKWLKGEILTLASTRLKRGADLKDDLCRCMIITKMPYPDKNDIRIKHLFESLPEELAHAVYKDIARRELIQQIGRGLRHDNDWVILAVLDRIALEELKQLNLWEMEEVGSIGEVVR